MQLISTHERHDATLLAALVVCWLSGLICPADARCHTTAPDGGSMEASPSRLHTSKAPLGQAPNAQPGWWVAAVRAALEAAEQVQAEALQDAVPMEAGAVEPTAALIPLDEQLLLRAGRHRSQQDHDHRNRSTQKHTLPSVGEI